MAETFNEDDELTRVLAWLKANGVALAVGIVLGLAIIIGWQWWSARVDSRAQASAALYQDVAQQIRQGNITPDVRATVDTLKHEYAQSPYAANAAMQLAAHAVSQQQYDKALAQLNWVVDNSDSVPTRTLASARKARVQWANGQPEAALKLLQAQHPDSFDRLYAELMGDIHAAQGQRAKAHSAYQRAEQAAHAGVGQRVLKRKLARTAPADKQTVARTGNDDPSTNQGA